VREKMRRREQNLRILGYILGIIILLIFGFSGVIFSQSPSATDDFAQTHYEKGKKAFTSQQWGEAIAAFTSALKFSDDKTLMANAYYFRGYSYYKIDDCRKATDDMNAMLAIVPAGVAEKQTALAKELIAECNEWLADSRDSAAYQQMLDSMPESASITFEKTFGGAKTDEAESVVLSADGGFVLAGCTTSEINGKVDVYIVKIDFRGDLKWEKAFGGSQGDFAHCVIRASDGGYVLAGGTGSMGKGDFDFYVLKVDSRRNLQWERNFGSVGDDIANSAIISPDDGVIVVGYSLGRGVLLLKIGSQGDLQWERNYFGLYKAWGNSIVLTSDSGYVVAGSTESAGVEGSDVYLFKIDSNGNLEWEKTFGGSGRDFAKDVALTSDGGYIVTGVIASPKAGDFDACLLKVDSGGNLQWEKKYGGSSNDWGNSVALTSDGGYIVGGVTESKGAGGRDFYLVKTDSLGNLEWEKTFGGSREEFLTSIRTTLDGGYILAGWTESFGRGESDIYLIKTDPYGDIQK
jgi:hypothetical protein